MREDPALDDPFYEWASGHLSLEALDASTLPAALAAARRASALEPTSWRHQFRLGMASWGDERLQAVDRTLTLLPGFAPARFLASMVFTARQAFGPALESADLGAQAQTRDAESDDSPFPPIGLHWLYGLLVLREGLVGPAIMEFAKEIDDAQRGRVYADEFRVNAQVAAGFAHLSIDDAAGAVDAFRSALATFPQNGRALIGLYQALRRTSFASESSQLLPQIDRNIAELVSGRRVAEGALVRAALQTARGNIEEACRTLRGLLEAAPPGQTGWIIPIDPSLASLRSASAFESVTALLAARAA